MALVCTTSPEQTQVSMVLVSTTSSIPDKSYFYCLDGPGRHHFIGTAQVLARSPLLGLRAVAFMT